jgi:hypothetical protein
LGKINGCKNEPEKYVFKNGQSEEDGELKNEVENCSKTVNPI